MSKEYRTLDQWFEGKDRGDGRKFTKEAYLGKSNYFFEPIFRGSNGVWHGVNNLKEHACHAGDEQCVTTFSPWVEWDPPKTKKKVTLYRPVFKNGYGSYYCEQNFDFSNYVKITDPVSIGGFFAGWMEVEVLVYE